MILAVGNCRVQATVPFFALIAFLLLMDQSGTALCGLAAAALHETGHLLAMVLCGRPPCRIRFTAFGAEIASENLAGSYWQDALVAAAGPVANLLLWGGTAVATTIFGTSGLLQILLLSNALLAGFNMLPVEPLDGGQALLSLLSLFLRREQAYQTVQIISFIVLVPMAALGFLVLFQSHWNITLLLAVVYLLFLLLMKTGRYA